MQKWRRRQDTRAAVRPGMHAISGDALGESSLSVVDAKWTTIGAARRVILLANHSRLRTPASFEAARAAESVHDLVTDEVTPEAALEASDSSATYAYTRFREETF